MNKSQRIEQDQQAWQVGFDRAMSGKPALPAPPRLSQVSYFSGWIEGEAARTRANRPESGAAG